MQKIRENSAKNILFILAIVLCICPLVYAAAEIRTFSHNEEKDYGPAALPRVLKSRVYEDGTVVIRIVRQNINTSTAIKDCFDEMLSLRIIHLNGTVDEKDIKLDIQQFNYCTIFNSTLLDYHLIRKNHILVTYYNATNVTDFYTYVEWGIIIDFDGNVYDRIPFGFAYIDENADDGSSFSTIQLNINKEKGFFRLTRDEWQQYRIELNGTFTKLTNGTLTDFDFFSSFMISTNNEGYALVYAKKMNDFNVTEPFLPQSGLFVLFIGYDQVPVSPLLLYQSSLNVTFTGISCGNLVIQVGLVCTLTIRPKDFDGISQVFYAKVNFLSSGSVTNLTTAINITDSTYMKSSGPPSATAPLYTITIDNYDLFIIWRLNSLPFGGYLLTYNTIGTIQDGNIIYGYLFNDDREPFPWDFKDPEPTNIDGVLEVLPHNNTILVAQTETNNSWGFHVTDLPKFAGGRDTDYFNLNVEATEPAIDSSINANTPKISIDFYMPVELSNGNLSIYQMVDDQRYLRQSIPGIKCSIENDGKTVTADVLESTFSVSNGSYFIKMDNNFVKDKAYKEPLLGIRENVWSFTTKEKRDAFSPSTTGLLRLTSSGTEFFVNLSQEERNKFFDTLLKELSDAVPVDLSRLNTDRIVKLDKNANEKQYLISVGIKEARDEHDNSVASIIRLIDIMVKNKGLTPIGLGQVTGYLDESYGFVQSQDLWDKRLLAFLIVGLFAVLFLILFFFARRRNRNGNNIVILQLGLIIFDSVMDILFASSNARDVPALFIPSVVFVTVPIGINMILTFFIIKKEYERPKFHQWFAAQKKFASGFTVLSSANIIALNILYSNLAGFSFLRAPFSDSAKSIILWGAFLNIFTADIPQVIIQILYRYNTDPMYYDIIPLLTLISSVVSLTVNLMGRLYQAKNYLRRRNRSANNTNSTDDSDTVVSSPSDDRDEQDLVKNTDDDTSSVSSKIESASSLQNYLGNVPEIEEKAG